MVWCVGSLQRRRGIHDPTVLRPSFWFTALRLNCKSDERRSLKCTGLLVNDLWAMSLLTVFSRPQKYDEACLNIWLQLFKEVCSHKTFVVRKLLLTSCQKIAGWKEAIYPQKQHSMTTNYYSMEMSLEIWEETGGMTALASRAEAVAGTLLPWPRNSHSWDCIGKSRNRRMVRQLDNSAAKPIA